MTLMHVRALQARPEGQQAIVVLETETRDRALGFAIPMNEAAHLAPVLGLTGCRCSPIIELLLELAGGLGARVTQAMVDHEEAGICATPSALAGAHARAGDPGPVAPAPDLSGWLAAVRPSDFGPAPSTGA